MCEICLNRRSMFRAVLGAAALAAVSPALAADGPKTSLTPQQALAALKEGNQRYVATPQLCAVDLERRRL